MKIIVAGFPKCGTKTVASALRDLGLKVYDFMENYEFLEDKWRKIFEEGVNRDDFMEMYENVDAVTDLPCCFFWKDLHKTFPQAKIIFMQRTTEDEWMQSFNCSINLRQKLVFKLLKIFSPTAAKLNAFLTDMLRLVFGFDVMNTSIINGSAKDLQMKQIFRLHNSYVLEQAPKDKLLIFNLNQGWGPLCKFLQLPIPKHPFPHKNKQGEYGYELLRTHPIFLQMQKELLSKISLPSWQASVHSLNAFLFFSSF